MEIAKTVELISGWPLKAKEALKEYRIKVEIIVAVHVFRYLNTNYSIVIFFIYLLKA